MKKNRIFPLHVKDAHDASFAGMHIGDGAEIPECRPPEDVPECPPEVRARVQHEVNELFRHANLEHPAMQELLRLCTERRIRKSVGER